MIKGDLSPLIFFEKVLDKSWRGALGLWRREILLYHTAAHFVKRKFAQKFMPDDPEILCKITYCISVLEVIL